MLLTHVDANVLFALAHSYNAIYETDSAMVYYDKTKLAISNILNTDSLNREALLADVLLSCELNDPLTILNNKIIYYCNSTIDSSYLKLGNKQDLQVINLRELKTFATGYNLNCFDLSELELRQSH